MIEQIQNITGLCIGQTIYLILKYNGKAYATASDYISQIAISKQGLYVKTRNHHQYNKQYRLGVDAFLTPEACNEMYMRTQNKT